MAQTVLAVAALPWAVLMGIAPVLQLRRMLREQSSRDVSVGYFVILLAGFLLWIAYGAAAGIPALIVPDMVCANKVWPGHRGRPGALIAQRFAQAFSVSGVTQLGW